MKKSRQAKKSSKVDKSSKNDKSRKTDATNLRSSDAKANDRSCTDLAE